jgi:hypothetical protein
MKSTFLNALLGSAIGASLLLAAGVAGAHHPSQHPGEGGHLIGSGEFGNLKFLSVERVTNTDDNVADVAVSPDGQWAYLANWGQPDCAGPETGGQNTPDAGAWVIDISDLGDPETVGFIPSHQDSRPGEGMQVVNITTKTFSGDVLVMNNEQCGKNGKGGVTLWDVTNPRKPVKLSEHFGDRTGTTRSDTHENHSVFAWDTGPNAYVVIVDNDEDPDVDILDITNPKRPRVIAEHDLEEKFPQITQSTPDNLSEIFLHDMVVKNIDGNWIMLLSYWDGGYVQLNVNDPTNPTLIGDTDYATVDPELPESAGVPVKPEGNGHQNEFTIDNAYFIATDEDFAPFGITGFGITTNVAGFQGDYPSSAVPGAETVASLPDQDMNGPVVYGGYGCPASAAIPTPASITGYEASLLPGEEKIIVLQRGPVGDPSAPEEACFPGEKAHEAFLAGWQAILFVERHEGAESPPFCGSGGFEDVIVGLCTTHEVLHRLFNTGPFVGPYAFGDYPDGPAIGAVSVDKISAFADFDGWGYVHLFDNTPVGGKFADLDTFAIPQAHDIDFGIGFGALSVHEVAVDPQNSILAYLSYYSGGMRAIKIDKTDPANPVLCQTGGYLDEGGNEFWGVEAFVRDGKTIVLGSDMDSGLWIFESQGDAACEDD